jgi:Flp pilus assembly protein TadG
MMVLGIIEFGRGMMVQQVLVNSTREGARRAIVNGITSAEATTIVSNLLSSAGIKNAVVTISPASIDTVGHGQPVTVSVSVAYKDVSWLPAPRFLKGKTLTARAVMRRETPN